METGGADDRDPKFEIGDVHVMDRGRPLHTGKITYGPRYDDFQDVYKYKVRDEDSGSTKFWNEDSLELVRGSRSSRNQRGLCGDCRDNRRKRGDYNGKYDGTETMLDVLRLISQALNEGVSRRELVKMVEEESEARYRAVNRS